MAKQHSNDEDSKPRDTDRLPRIPLDDIVKTRESELERKERRDNDRREEKRERDR